MSNLLSDNHKIETIKFGRKKQSTISSKNVESLFISLTSRYFEGIKKQIQDLIINSNGKDLNVGKIVAPALKVLWLEGLHEGLFYDRKKNIEYTTNNNSIQFAQIDLSGRDQPKANLSSFQERVKSYVTPSSPRGVAMLLENLKSVDNLPKDIQTRILDHVEKNYGQYSNRDLDLIYDSLQGKNKKILTSMTRRTDFTPTNSVPGQKRVEKLEKQRIKLKKNLKEGRLTKEELQALKQFDSLPEETQNAVRTTYLGREDRDLLGDALVKRDRQRRNAKVLKESTTELRQRGIRISDRIQPKGKETDKVVKTNFLDRLLQSRDYDEIERRWEDLDTYQRRRVLKKYKEEQDIQDILNSNLSTRDKEDSIRSYLGRDVDINSYTNARVPAFTDQMSAWAEVDSRARKQLKSKIQKDMPFRVETSDIVTRKKIEQRAPKLIPYRTEQIDAQIDTIVSNPNLSKEEKVQAINRIYGPTGKGKVKRQARQLVNLREKDTLEASLLYEEKRKQLSTYIANRKVDETRKVPGLKVKERLQGLLGKEIVKRPRAIKGPGIGVDLSFDVDVRERIRDIETYYPYLANTEERLSDVQAYIDSRTIELSNYYTEEFKDNLKTQIAEITKDTSLTDGKRKQKLKELFESVAYEKASPEEESKANNLIKQLQNEFNLKSKGISYSQIKTNKKRLERLRISLDENSVNLNKYKALGNILKKLTDNEELDVNDRRLIKEYGIKATSFEDLRVKITEARAKFGNDYKQNISQLAREYNIDLITKDGKINYPDTQRALSKLISDNQQPKVNLRQRDTISTSKLPPNLVKQLEEKGYLKQGQKTISKGGVEKVVREIRSDLRTRGKFNGVNPIIKDQYLSLQEARKEARRELYAITKENTKQGKDTDPELFNRLVEENYIRIHEAKLGRKIDKKSRDDFPPDNINNLIVNPFNRLERIINNELTTSYNLGRIEAFIRNGVKQVRWISTLDTKTSTFCMSLNNRIFNLTEIQAFATGRGLLYPYFPNTKKTFDEVKRNSAIGVFYLPSVHPYCRSYLEPIPPQEELESEKKNFFSTYQQVLSEQLAANKISPESLVNNDRLLQAMVVMGAVGLNIKARGDRRKREEERRRRLIAAGSVLATGVGLYAIARSRVGQQLYDNAVDALQRGRRVVPDDNLVQDFVEASSRAVDDTIEEITDVSPNTLVSSIDDIVESRPPLALPPAKDVTDIPTPSQRLVELPENLDPELEAVLREPSFRPAIEAVRNFDDDLPVNPTVVDRPPLSISPRQAQRIEDILKNARDITEDNISDIEEASTVVGKIEAYIKARTGKTPEGRQSLDVTLLQDLIQINDRTSSQIITNVLRYQARDIQNVSDNIDLMLSKAFKGRLPNTNNITEVRIVDKANKLYRVKQNGKYSLINSELEPTVISNYISELKAKRRQLNQNLSRAKTKETQVRLKNLLKEYEASISKLEKLFGSPLPSNRNSQLTQKQLKPIQSRIDTANKLYQELDEMNLTIRTKRGRVVQVDAKSVIGNAGQRAISFRTFLKTIDSPNIVSSSNVPLSNSLREKLKERYTKFFFRESQIRGLALRYRGSLREDFELFVSRPNLTSADIDLKVEQLEQLKIYIEQQIRTKGNSVLSDYDIFVQELDNASRIFPKLSRSPNVTTNERKFFTDNINLYINDVTRDIDNQIAMIRDMK